MNRTEYLKRNLRALFRSGADGEHDAQEMQELLEDLDFASLHQALLGLREPVYAYRVDSGGEQGFSYRGPELLPCPAIRLYTDEGDAYIDVAYHAHAYELWLLPDAGFVVLSRVRTAIGDAESVMEYRCVKGMNWKEAGMYIDFLELADALEDLVAAFLSHELPRYEL